MALTVQRGAEPVPRVQLSRSARLPVCRHHSDRVPRPQCRGPFLPSTGTCAHSHCHRAAARTCRPVNMQITANKPLNVVIFYCICQHSITIVRLRLGNPGTADLVSLANSTARNGTEHNPNSQHAALLPLFSPGTSAATELTSASAEHRAHIRILHRRNEWPWDLPPASAGLLPPHRTIAHIFSASSPASKCVNRDAWRPTLLQ